MKQYEEELQKRVEGGNPSGHDDAEIRAYQQVFQALKNEPEFELPASFADRVVKLAEAKQQARSTSREYFWLGIGLFFLLIAFVAAIALTQFKLDFGFLRGMSSYTGIFIFGIAFITLLNLMDKKLIHKNQVSG